MKTFNKQGGFTLVEVTTVLVIGGLILGGVLKGQSLIEAGRVKSAVSQLNSIAIAHSAYVERYQALPGDDGTAALLATRGDAWTGATAGNRNGVIDGTLANTFAPVAATAATATAAATALADTVRFFEHLRRAGFLTGDPAVGTTDATVVEALPMNAWGGRTAVANAISIQGRSASGKQLIVCLSSVPGQAAISIDKQLDDGLPNGGSLRATLSDGTTLTAPGTAATTYVGENFYTLCRDL